MKTLGGNAQKAYMFFYLICIRAVGSTFYCLLRKGYGAGRSPQPRLQHPHLFLLHRKLSFTAPPPTPDSPASKAEKLGPEMGAVHLRQRTLMLCSINKKRPSLQEGGVGRCGEGRRLWAGLAHMSCEFTTSVQPPGAEVLPGRGPQGLGVGCTCLGHAHTCVSL